MDNSITNEKIDDSIQIIEDTQTIDSQVVEVPDLKGLGDSESLFPDSPVYEPDDNILGTPEELTFAEDIQRSDQIKRKLSSDAEKGFNKIPKLDAELQTFTQNLDDEVSEIISNAIKRKQPYEDPAIPSTSRVRTPVRSSPRKITKRSNSTTDVTKTPKTPKTPKRRPGSADITRSTPRKLNKKNNFTSSEDIPIAISVSSNELEKKNSPLITCEPIAEEDDANDSQNLRLVLSPSIDESAIEENNKSTIPNYSSDPVLFKDRKEILMADKTNVPRSEGYNYSDQSSNLCQNIRDMKGKTTDQESTDSASSIILDSPENVPTVTSKIISQLSNGHSSTPTELVPGVKHLYNDSDCTPDMIPINGQKGKRAENEIFRVSNTTTPSTISPLQNGHSLPTMHTPQVPTFEIHVRHNEEGEFLALYIVRTDNDIGMDMCKEYLRVSKRFTMDPYLADISSSTSPSSVASTSVINLQNRSSFVSTVSTSTSCSSNRTSDGAFVVPQPPKKNTSYPSSTTVKGYDAVIKKLNDIFSHIRETSLGEANRSSTDDKISIGVQASSPSSSLATTSNGTASPEEMSNYDKATPKSSLKKTRVRGRRPMTGKTKRAILPTQIEEPEYVLGMNSPEMVTFADSPLKSPNNDEKPLIATPKSVSKLKQKRRPISPRPATPVEKVVKCEYPGFGPNTVVLAKWVDKRYYSGRVLEILEPSKYLIKFDDGKSKPLLDDFIIFGDTSTLPLLGKSVFAMVDKEQTYEPALVLGIDETEGGDFTYRCLTDGEQTVCVTASGLYVTEDQARYIKDSANPKSPLSAPSTPRRRGMRELDLDNIIQGPRSARSRDKTTTSSGKKTVNSPKSPKASTSGVRTKPTHSGVSTIRTRVASESSELSESSNPPPAPRIDDVVGVEPEVQRTPKKIDGVKAGPLQLKGAAKQNIGKKNSKLTKFENEEDIVAQLGPIPEPESKLFAGMHFLLTCTETPKKPIPHEFQKPVSYPLSDEGDSSTSTAQGTDCEDLVFCAAPYNRERLREQLIAGGGTVHTHFDEIPKSKYHVTQLIAPRPCLTAKYIQCVAAAVRALSHGYVLHACAAARRPDRDAYLLPAGWSLLRGEFVTRNSTNGKRTSLFKDKVILLCGDQDTFIKFWERVCNLSGAITRVVNEDDLNMTDAIALVTEWDCPHEVQNKANQDNVPLVSTTWVVQCLIESRIISPTAHVKFSFMYTEPE